MQTIQCSVWSGVSLMLSVLTRLKTKGHLREHFKFILCTLPCVCVWNNWRDRFGFFLFVVWVFWFCPFRTMANYDKWWAANKDKTIKPIVGKILNDEALWARWWGNKCFDCDQFSLDTVMTGHNRGYGPHIGSYTCFPTSHIRLHLYDWFCISGAINESN